MFTFEEAIADWQKIILDEDHPDLYYYEYKICPGLKLCLEPMIHKDWYWLALYDDESAFPGITRFKKIPLKAESIADLKPAFVFMGGK